MSTKLRQFLFGRTKADFQIQKINVLIDKAISEHNVAANLHKKRLEQLRKEVRRLELEEIIIIDQKEEADNGK